MGTDRTAYLALQTLVRRHERPWPSLRRGPLTASELRGFSQNGEDGVIAEVLRRIGARTQTFVEFGVESGIEGNCVFLADVLRWQGLFIEDEPANFARLSAKYGANERVRTLHATVTPETIEDLISGAGLPRELDVLSIDIDSADYWVWAAITSFSPRLVVIEYNAALGLDRVAVQPRDHAAGWNGTDDFGASLPALEQLGAAKGYRLVHTDLTGCNAFFVRDDLAADRFPAPADVVRIGEPNYFLQGARHAHDEATVRFVDPTAELALLPRTIRPAQPRLSPTRRASLTVRHHGWREFARRLAAAALAPARRRAD